MQKYNETVNNVWTFLFEERGCNEPDKEVKKVINKLSELSNVSDFDDQKIWFNLLQKITNTQKEKRTLRYKLIAKYVAIIALVLTVSVVLFLHKKPNEQTIGSHAWGIVANKKTNDVHLILESGKTVTLPEQRKVAFDEKDSMILQSHRTATLSYKKKSSNLPPKAIVYNTLDIPLTKIYKLELSDGSLVYLNADSRIRFPKTFARNERRVFLERGEAYFDVVKDVNAPFMIEVRDTEIEVLGTAFNISAYSEDSRIMTTLVRGSVKVHKGKEEVVLIPGQQAIENDSSLSVKEVDTSVYTAWKDGIFVFKKQSLESVVWQIHRWYGCSIILSDDTLKKVPLTGAIDRELPLKEIFRILEKTTRIKIEFESKDRVKISSRN